MRRARLICLRRLADMPAPEANVIARVPAHLLRAKRTVFAPIVGGADNPAFRDLPYHVSPHDKCGITPGEEKAPELPLPGLFSHWPDGRKAPTGALQLCRHSD